MRQHNNEKPDPLEGIIALLKTVNRTA